MSRWRFDSGSSDNKSARRKTAFKAGEYVFRENEPGDAMFIIQEGLVDVLKAEGGEERRLARLEPGDFFGEMAILEQLPRAGSARAVNDCQLMCIDASAFDQLLATNPEIAVRMLRRLSRRLRHAVGDAESQQPVTEVPAPPVRRTGAEALVHEVSGQRFSLCAAAETKVGRPDAVTGSRPDIDLSANDTERTVSRHHASIVRQGTTCFLHENIGAPNGTFLNGRRLQTGQSVLLSSGDRIRFGNVETVFQGQGS